MPIEVRHAVPAILSCGLLLLAACNSKDTPPKESVTNSGAGAGGGAAPGGGDGGFGGGGGAFGGDGGFSGGPSGDGGRRSTWYQSTNAGGGAGGNNGCPNAPAMWNVSGIVTGVVSGGAVQMTEELLLRVPEEGAGYADELRAQPTGLLAFGGPNVWDVVSRDGSRWYSSDSYYTEDVLASDLDGDGDADLVTSDVFFDGDVTMGYVLTVWERAGDALDKRTELPALATQSALRVATSDLDSDGDLDLVTFDDGRVVVQRNDGDFTFERIAGAAAEPYDQYTTALALLIEDRNADGDADVVALVDKAQVLTFASEGDFEFAAPVVQDVNGIESDDFTSLADVHAGDVTGDGLSDFVATIYSDALLIPSGAGAIEVKQIFDYATRVTLVDFDGDGTLDIAAITPNGMELLLASGDGDFSESAIELSSFHLSDFELTAVPSDQAIRIDALYTIECPRPCDDSCGRCMLGACIECLSHSDCASGSCRTHQCVSAAEGQ